MCLTMTAICIISYCMTELANFATDLSAYVIHTGEHLVGRLYVLCFILK